MDGTPESVGSRVRRYLLEAELERVRAENRQLEEDFNAVLLGLKVCPEVVEGAAARLSVEGTAATRFASRDGGPAGPRVEQSPRNSPVANSELQPSSSKIHSPGTNSHNHQQHPPARRPLVLNVTQRNNTPEREKAPPLNPPGKGMMSSYPWQSPASSPLRSVSSRSNTAPGPLSDLFEMYPPDSPLSIRGRRQEAQRQQQRRQEEEAAGRGGARGWACGGGGRWCMATFAFAATIAVACAMILSSSGLLIPPADGVVLLASPGRAARVSLPLFFARGGSAGAGAGASVSSNQGGLIGGFLKRMPLAVGGDEGEGRGRKREADAGAGATHGGWATAAEGQSRKKERRGRRSKHGSSVDGRRLRGGARGGSHGGGNVEARGVVGGGGGVSGGGRAAEGGLRWGGGSAGGERDVCRDGGKVCRQGGDVYDRSLPAREWDRGGGSLREETKKNLEKAQKLLQRALGEAGGASGRIAEGISRQGGALAAFLAEFGLRMLRDAVPVLRETALAASGFVRGSMSSLGRFVARLREVGWLKIGAHVAISGVLLLVIDSVVFV